MSFPNGPVPGALGPPPPASSGARRATSRVVGALLALMGLLAVVAGTFLPWLVSGGVRRSSYAVIGVVDRLGLVHNAAAELALSSWPLLGAVAMLPVLAGILRWWRTAGAGALGFGLLTGVIGGFVLAVAGGGSGSAGLSIDLTGPLVTVIGAGCAVFGGVLLIVSGRRPTQPGKNFGSDVSPEPADGSFRRTFASAPAAGSEVHTVHRSHPQEPHLPSSIAEQ